MSLLHLLTSSSGSLANMANAMLEDEGYKNSHPDLTIWNSKETSISVTSLTSNDNDTTLQSSVKKVADNLIEKVSLSSSNKRSSSDPRSVVIQVPPTDNGTKRRKLDPSLTARRLVYEIGTSASLQDRLLVLQKAKEFLDHDNTSEHDDEIQFDLDVALTKQLVMLVLKLSRCRSNMLVPVNAEDETDQAAIIEEVSSTLEAFEMVYRASDSAVGDSFRKIGPDLLHVLVSAMDEELNRRVVTVSNEQDGGSSRKVSTSPHHDDSASTNSSSNTNRKNVDSAQSTPELQPVPAPTTIKPATTMVKEGTPEGNHLILKATKVMGHLARVGKATKPMAFFPGLLRCMLNLINFQPYDSIPWEARLSALWILGQLACNPSNMQMMMCTPGLVRSLVRVGCRALHADDPMEVTMEVLRSRSLSSRALLNLSWKPENKIPLSENLALVELLTQLAVHRKAPAFNHSKTVQNILQQTRCHAVGGLRNLAAAPRRTKIQLCNYRHGHVLDALTDVALNDPDLSIQNRAFAAIHNLAVHDNAEKMVERPALVLALKDVLLEEQQQQKQQDESAGGSGSGGGTPRSHAAATLLVLERTITPDMASYQNLRDLLDAVNPTVPSDNEEDNNQNDNNNVGNDQVNDVDEDDDDDEHKHITTIEV